MNDETTRAINTLARDVVARSVILAEVEWEDYPDVGEYDWLKVIDEAKRIANSLRPSKPEYGPAYDHLKQRAAGAES